MSIADTNLDIDQLTEEIQRENDRRYAFNRMLGATDTVLFWLEELNKDGAKKLPGDLGLRIRDTLRELPATCLEVLVGGSVQQVLDSVFDVQERLFLWHDPTWVASDEDEGGADPRERYRARVMELIDGSSHGVAWSELVPGKLSGERRLERIDWLGEMQREGLIRWGMAPAGGRRAFRGAGRGD